MEELVISSNKLDLIPREKLWENLTLSLLTDLRDLMSQVEMFAQLEDNFRQVEQTIGITSKDERHFKRQKEGSYKN